MDTRIAVLWKDGRKFSQRIQVWFGERFLYRAHKEEAFRLCSEGSAKPTDDGNEIYRIILIRVPADADRLGNVKAMTPYSYAAGQRLINKEMLVGEKKIPFKSFSYKKLRESDRWAYIKSMTDCISPWPEKITSQL